MHPSQLRDWVKKFADDPEPTAPSSIWIASASSQH
jgi:hypothetical protein